MVKIAQEIKVFIEKENLSQKSPNFVLTKHNLIFKTIALRISKTILQKSVFNTAF